MDLFSASDGSAAWFDDVARRTARSWIDALCDGLGDLRRASLAREIAERFDSDAPDRAIYREEGWLRGEGKEAGWMLARWCRDTLASATRHSYPFHVNVAFDLLARVFADEVWLPWVWIEILVAAPAHQRILAQQLSGYALNGPGAWPAIRHALAGKTFPHRRLLALRLEREGGIDGALALAWLRDRSLRAIAEGYLRERVAEHGELLRAMLDGDCSSGMRESVVRLLRRIDPQLSLDGRSEASTDAELQARLREDPRDRESLRVWADLLETAGDPRGAHVALELAILDAAPARALELSREAAALCREHRAAIWNRPGGVPFREKYRGREQVAFQSDANHRVRGSSIEALVDRLQRFANHVTDQHGPSEIHLGSILEEGPAIATIDAHPGPIERELLVVLGGATALYDEHGHFVRRSHPEEPLAFERGLREVCATHAHLTLHYVFQLTWPGTRIPLAHQEGEHYASGEPLVGRLAVHLASRRFNLSLRFPFERFDDDGFLAVYDAICGTLGRVMTPSRFATLVPSADGKRMVSVLARFDRLP